MDNEHTVADAINSVNEVKKLVLQLYDAGEQRDKELLRKSDIDPLLEEKLAKINGAIDAHNEVIEKLYASNRRKNVTLDGKTVSQDSLERKSALWGQAAAKAQDKVFAGHTADAQMAYKTCLDAYLRVDDKGLSPDETKALSVGSSRDGGFFVDADTTGRIVSRVFETSEIRRYASTQIITGPSLDGIHDLDEVSAGWVSETGGRPATATPKITPWSIPLHERYAAPTVTQRFLDEANIDVQGWLAEKTADKFARLEAAASVNGTGSGQPRGLNTYPAGTAFGQIEQLATGASGAFASDPAGADKLIEMQTKLEVRYRANAVWTMSRITQGGVRLLKDSEGRYLWQPAITAGQPATLLGHPVATFDDMAPYTESGALAIGFGDIAQAYQIVDRALVTVLRDPYSSKPYVMFYTTGYNGGDVIDFRAYKLLKFGS